MMAIPTLTTAILLIIIGVGGYLAQDPNAGKVSGTALIPAGFGLVLAICGWLAFNDRLRKTVMHIAVVVGLLGAIGAPYPIIKRLVKGNDIAFHEPAVASALATTVILVIFVIMCVNSFIQARKARKLAAAQATS